MQDYQIQDVLKQHPLVVRRLLEAGWSENRSVNISEQVAFLQKFGFPINALARQAMRNLGGLCFQLPEEGGICRVVFDPREGILAPDYLARVEEVVGTKDLTLIGAGGGYLILLAPDGQAFLLQDEWLALIGFETLGDLLYFAISGNQTVCHDYPRVVVGT